MRHRSKLIAITTLLVFSLMAVAVVTYAEGAPPIYIPLVQNGSSAVERAAADESITAVPTPSYKVDQRDLHLLEQIGRLPYSEVPPPDAITLRPADIFNQPIPAATLEALHSQISISHQPVSGPETAGTFIDLAGRSIQLPDEFYVYTYVTDVYCEYIQFEDGSTGTYGYCPPTPHYGIAKLGVDPTKQMIRVEPDGQAFIIDTLANEDKVEQISITFTPILNLLNTSLIVDPSPDIIIKIESKQ